MLADTVPADGGGGVRYRAAVELNGKVHEVFAGPAEALEPDQLEEGSWGGTTGDEGDGEPAGGDGKGAGSGLGEKAGDGTQGGSDERGAGGGHDGSGGKGAGGAEARKRARPGSAPRADGPSRERPPPPRRSSTPVAELVDLLRAEVAAAGTARAESHLMQQQLLEAFKEANASAAAAREAEPLAKWAESLPDSLLTWLIAENLICERFTTTGCFARALTVAERAEQGVTPKIFKRLLDYKVVLTA
jgi:hypothetical protein